MKMLKKNSGLNSHILFVLVILAVMPVHAQIKIEIDPRTKDSLYITEVEETHKSAKVLHAEPLFIDLIRDLGARKGENRMECWRRNYG